MMETFKQFLKDCWYAPLWLKLTNGIWIAILTFLFWGGVTWFVNTANELNPEPHTLESALLGASIMLFPLLMVAVMFALRFIYEWIATKVLVHFGFIEQKQ